MLTALTLKNFKVFKEKTSFPLARLNLLTGINGRGKSTLLQSLLLLKQSIDQNPTTDKLHLNGSCIDLGTFSDVKNESATQEDEIIITYDYLFGDIYEGKITYHFISSLDEKNDFLQIKLVNDKKFFLHEKEVSGDNVAWEDKYIYEKDANSFLKKTTDGEYRKTSLLFYFLFPYDESTLKDFNYEIQKNTADYLQYYDLSKIKYIPAARIGPQNYYEKYAQSKKSEDTVKILAEKRNHLVYDELYLGNNAQILIEQTGEWLSKILDTAHINLKIDDNSNDYIITLNFQIGNQIRPFKAPNVGFGYTYILPIVVAGLTAEKGEIIIVENPEAHLHPKAQSELAKFLVKVASCGVQIFVESHSEHILNAFRIAVVKEEFDIQAKDVNVLYFQNGGESYFTQIEIQEDGRIENWEQGFFDQSDKDFDIIFGSKS